MIGLLLVLVVTITALVYAVYLLGFRLGRGHRSRGRSDWTSVRMDAANAERALYDLTRQGMAEITAEAMRGRYGDPGEPGSSISPRS
jgi:hypothetical protein